jgi:hypothetical protein
LAPSAAGLTFNLEPLFTSAAHTGELIEEGALNSIAVRSASRIGEGPNSIELSRDYTIDLVDRGERHDLLAKLNEIFDWFEAQRSQIEAQLPACLGTG